MWWEGGTASCDPETGIVRNYPGSSELPSAVKVSTYKKGGRSSYENQREIRFASIVFKLRAGIIVRRPPSTRGKGMHEKHTGFRRRRGCIDHISNL